MFISRSYSCYVNVNLFAGFFIFRTWNPVIDQRTVLIETGRYSEKQLNAMLAKEHKTAKKLAAVPEGKEYMYFIIINYSSSFLPKTPPRTRTAMT